MYLSNNKNGNIQTIEIKNKILKVNSNGYVPDDD